MEEQLAFGVVLSGGGPLAVAWECGVASGLASGGVLLSAADRILGTSAGAIVGAQLAAGRDPRAMAQAIVDEKNGVPPPGARTAYAQEAIARLPELFAKAQSGDAGRAEVGAYALQAATPEDEPSYVARIELSLGLTVWPERSLAIVVLDAGNGEAVVFGRDSEATLGQAVAASCSLPGLSPPVGVGGRRYIDGGMRSASNADLIAGCDAVLLLCFTPSGPAADRMIVRARAQAELLISRGTEVKIISPDERCLAAIGARTMDVTRRPDVAQAGTVQGAALAADLVAFSTALAS